MKGQGMAHPVEQILRRRLLYMSTDEGLFNSARNQKVWNPNVHRNKGYYQPMPPSSVRCRIGYPWNKASQDIIEQIQDESGRNHSHDQFRKYPFPLKEENQHDQANQKDG